MNKKKVLSIIALVSSMSCSQGIVNSKVFGITKEKTSDVASATRRVDKLNEDPKEMEKQLKEKKKYEKTEKMFTDFIQKGGLDRLSEISVEKIEDNIVYLKYDRWVGCMGVFKYETTCDLRNMDASCKEIVDYFIEKGKNFCTLNDKVPLTSSLVEWLQGRKKFGELFDKWVEDGIYEDKITEIGKPCVLKLKSDINKKISEFKKKSKKNAKE